MTEMDVIGETSKRSEPSPESNLSNHFWSFIIMYVFICVYGFRLDSFLACTGHGHLRVPVHLPCTISDQRSVYPNILIQLLSTRPPC